MTKEIQNPFLEEEYISRINLVVNYIDSNLDKKLDLETLAGIVHFSPYHFHRIFKAIMSETLNRYINRRRLEKAAFQLIIYPKNTITRIAYHCGFNSSIAFTRAFRNCFKTSPGKWRKFAYEKTNNNSKEDDAQNNSEYIKRLSIYINRWYDLNNKRLKVKPISIDVTKIPDMSVAYIRLVGSFFPDSKSDGSPVKKCIKQLIKWADPRGLLRFPETKIMAVYHDKVHITDLSKYRSSICITVPEDIKTDGKIGMMIVPGGKYAIGHYEIEANQYIDAWESLYITWLFGSGYQPDDRPLIEVYLNDPDMHPENKHIVDLYYPVKTL